MQQKNDKNNNKYIDVYNSYEVFILSRASLLRYSNIMKDEIIKSLPCVKNNSCVEGTMSSEQSRLSFIYNENIIANNIIKPNLDKQEDTSAILNDMITEIYPHQQDINDNKLFSIYEGNCLYNPSIQVNNTEIDSLMYNNKDDIIQKNIDSKYFLVDCVTYVERNVLKQTKIIHKNINVNENSYMLQIVVIRIGGQGAGHIVCLKNYGDKI